MSTAENVNWWTEPEWALRYLRERDAIPHRVEGLEVLLELLPKKVERVLDLGTGDGNTLALVLSAHPQAQGIGIDLGDEMLRHARERFAGDERVELRQHDMDNPLPADLDGFDAIVSSFAIHHLLPERQRALYGEIFERLRPGGVFLNAEHVASRSDELHVEFLAAINKTPEQDDPSNKLVLVETQLQWLDEIGYRNADCFWKWRELAVFGGSKA